MDVDDSSAACADAMTTGETNEGFHDHITDPTNADTVEGDKCGDKFDQLKFNMISRVAKSEAHFKHQQRGDPDLSYEEKVQIATEVLSKGPGRFLARFGQFLAIEDVDYFVDFKEDYEVDFYLKEILKQQDKVHSQKVVKNRRYAAMQELLSQGDYFSEEEMKWRDPLLYEQMVGNFLTEEEIQSKVDKTDLRFSNILLKHIDQIEENALYARQKEAEECQEEEEEDSEEEEEMEKKKPKISDVEKQMLKSEFLQIMQERFMSGKDKDFDYSQVDKNADYDSLDTLGKDEEERYFDGEEPFTVDSPLRTDSPRLAGSLQPVDDGEIKDYMSYEAEPDLSQATTDMNKMSVSQVAEDDEMLEKGVLWTTLKNEVCGSPASGVGDVPTTGKMQAYQLLVVHERRLSHDTTEILRHLRRCSDTARHPQHTQRRVQHSC
ncbi:coiled-coil domain-containing protein 97-like [Haliotis rubra]|uniref:coiled-coil domain-containing protein 97-like n=1 Tax=Haliotis rubra TaxID=36100 RepID=UPI001EE54EFD|nr:coiled-coil domain-containing protein 97-like [Haliotis rubra]